MNYALTEYDLEWKQDGHIAKKNVSVLLYFSKTLQKCLISLDVGYYKIKIMATQVDKNIIKNDLLGVRTRILFYANDNP